MILFGDRIIAALQEMRWRMIWDNPNENETRKLLRLGRRELGLLIGILTGHSALLSHLLSIGAVESGICRACEEDVETFKHYLCNCPAEIRFGTLCRDPISLEDHRGTTGWRKIWRYVRTTEFLTYGRHPGINLPAI